MLYVRREYTAVMDALPDLQGLILLPSQLTEQQDDKWSGMIFIRAERSPWHKGAFAFTVTIPPKYPFECPVAEFDLPLVSHPMLQDGRRVPFEAEYVATDAMHVSVMLRLLKFIRRLFLPQEWKRTARDGKGEVKEISAPPIDYRLCQQDVELRSVAQEVILSKPYVEYLTVEVKEWVLRSHRVGEGNPDEKQESQFSAWLTRSFLPTSRAVQ
jgi:hypothetical protein